MPNNKHLYLGPTLHFLGDPDSGENQHEFISDGALIVENGKVVELIDSSTALKKYPGAAITRFSEDKLILPGFVDTHLHFPQTDIIASYGKQLLEWLNTYTFPEEGKFNDPNHAAEVAGFFLEMLFRHGTTSAMVFPTVHPASVDALFGAALEKNMRLISGKVMMDRHCPEFLRDSPRSGYIETSALIAKWRNQGRLLYALTPRFAPTSTPEQMEQVARLASEYPDMHLQTHLAENKAEIKWVSELYPKARSYLDVYDNYGLVRPKAVFAHCIYLDETDRERMGKAGATIAHCPTSNLFLGSGLMERSHLEEAGIRIGIGTDVGGGSSFSMLRTLDEAYKVSQLVGKSNSPLKSFYMATLGGAKSLHLDSFIGNFANGKEADFIVLDLACTPLISRRMQHTKSLEERLFVLQTLGDDRAIHATYLVGNKVHQV